MLTLTSYSTFAFGSATVVGGSSTIDMWTPISVVSLTSERGLRSVSLASYRRTVTAYFAGLSKEWSTSNT